MSTSKQIFVIYWYKIITKEGVILRKRAFEGPYSNSLTAEENAHVLYARNDVYRVITTNSVDDKVKNDVCAFCVDRGTEEHPYPCTLCTEYLRGEQ